MSSRVGMNVEKTIKNRSPNLYNQIFICNTFLLLVQYLRPMGHLNTITPQLLLNDKGDNVQQYGETEQIKIQCLNTKTHQRLKLRNTLYGRKNL